jgi:hypothetical protein
MYQMIIASSTIPFPFIVNTRYHVTPCQKKVPHVPWSGNNFFLLNELIPLFSHGFVLNKSLKRSHRS